MAMTTSRECSADISTTAKACPKCGAVVPKAAVWPWLIGIPVGLFVLMLIYGASIPEYESNARELRRVCEQMAPLQREECARIYYRALEEGKARAGKQR